MTGARRTGLRRMQIHRTSRWRGLDDQGSATIWVLAAMSVVLLAGFAGIALGAAVLARHRAENAADLAAVAGATALVSGSGAPCAAAAALVHANGGQLVSCSVLIDDVVVSVRVAPVGLPARWGSAEARARAGPVDLTGAGSAEQGTSVTRGGPRATSGSGAARPPAGTTETHPEVPPPRSPAPVSFGRPCGASAALPAAGVPELSDVCPVVASFCCCFSDFRSERASRWRRAERLDPTTISTRPSSPTNPVANPARKSEDTDTCVKEMPKTDRSCPVAPSSQELPVTTATMASTASTSRIRPKMIMRPR